MKKSLLFIITLVIISQLHTRIEERVVEKIERIVITDTDAFNAKDQNAYWTNFISSKTQKGLYFTLMPDATLLFKNNGVIIKNISRIIVAYDERKTEITFFVEGSIKDRNIDSITFLEEYNGICGNPSRIFIHAEIGNGEFISLYNILTK